MDCDNETLLAYVEAAAEGDNVAVGELVRCTQPAVWRLCSLLGSRGEEDDLVQETYLRALSSLSGYRREAPVQVWLLSVARHVCADHVRRRQRQRRLVKRLAHYTDRQAVQHPTESYDDLLDQLDPDRRAAFVATQVLGLSYEQAAIVLDCPIGTVRSRVSRARSELLVAVRAAQAR